ncbi:hypothetical protein DXU93_05170 [Brumimicrobium aurantiacum]|uniref:Uncharacterized protein n=2 Tax=Brumimicrobium aurantiacum TaxID=1737063 RepID=A0A3E1F078_9FLAO|nr:hypothetical protein DXU93_05170 [Brumimicrobium aurantiacum]
MNSVELTKNQRISNSVNIFAFLSIITAIVFLIFKLWSESKFMTTTMIPDYTVLYMNKAEINLIAFLIGSTIPALYFRFRGQHLISTVCISVFYIMGLFFKNSVDIIENWYALV